MPQAKRKQTKQPVMSGGLPVPTPVKTDDEWIREAAMLASKQVPLPPAGMMGGLVSKSIPDPDSVVRASELSKAIPDPDSVVRESEFMLRGPSDPNSVVREDEDVRAVSRCD